MSKLTLTNHDTGASRPVDSLDYRDERDELCRVIRLLDAEICRLRQAATTREDAEEGA